MTRLPPAFLLCVAVLALPGCSLLGDSAPGAGAKSDTAAAAAANAPLVVVASAQTRDLVDSVEAVGTAHANEQADINSTVTERIARINFTDGQRVPRGAVIAELVQAEQSATLNENRARLREAELQLARLKQLQAQGFATTARIEQQQAAVDVARAGTQQADSQISDRVIRAPFSGWLSLRRISPGTVVNAGTTIVTIVDHSTIKLDFTVPETYLPALKPGLEISATAAAFPGEQFRGRISSIDPVLDPVTRSATARAILPNPDLRLRPGMLMTVDISSPARSALTVPELSVIGEGSGAYVWKVSPDNQAVRANVTAGIRRDGLVEILSGLQPGDRVVSEGTVKLRGPGPVKPTEPPKTGPQNSGLQNTGAQKQTAAKPAAATQGAPA